MTLDQRRRLRDLVLQQEKSLLSRQHQQASRFETETVQRVLAQLRFSRHRIQLVRGEEAAQTGTPGLSCLAFNAAVPEFPFFLATAELATPLHTDKAATLPSLFKNFQASPWGTLYRQAQQRQRRTADRRPLLLVLPRVGIPGGLAAYPAADWLPDGSGLQLLYRGDSESPLPSPLVIEPFTTVLQTLRRAHWKPAEETSRE